MVAFLDSLGTRQIVCMSLAIFYTVFAVLSTMLFYHYRDDTGIRHRGVHLTVISAVVNVPLTVVMLLWTPMDSNIPGWLVLWVLSLLIPTWVLLSFSRFIRLVFLYRVSEAKLLAADRGHGVLLPDSIGSVHQMGSAGSRRSVSITSLVAKEMFERRSFHTGHSSFVLDPEEDLTPEQMLQRNWFHRNRKRVTARIYMQIVAAFMVLHVIVTGIVFGIYAATAWSDITGSIRERHYSLLPLEILCMVWYGVLIFFLREQTKLRDSHGIHLECKVWMPISAILYSTFLITSWAFPETADLSQPPSVFPPIAYAALHFVVGHCIFVLWPALRVWQARRQRAQVRRQPSRNDQDRRAFEQLLADPRRFNKFKAFCVTDFSVENALFLERYRRFKELAALGNQTGTTFSASSGAGKILEKGVAFFIGANGTGGPHTTSEETSSLADHCTTYQVTQRLSDDAVKELKAVYATFMAPDAEFEVNLTSGCRQAVADRIRDGDATGDVLDEAQREIHVLVYQSTYPRYLAHKRKRVSRSSSLNGAPRVSQMAD